MLQKNNCNNFDHDEVVALPNRSNRQKRLTLNTTAQEKTAQKGEVRFDKARKKALQARHHKTPLTQSDRNAIAIRQNCDEFKKDKYSRPADKYRALKKTVS